MHGRAFIRLALFLCTGWLGGARVAYSYSPPQTEAGENGWEIYIDSPTLDKAAAREIKPGQDSPEAAVAHFFASLVRGDREYLAVVPPEGERSTQCSYALEKIQSWRFNKFRLVSRKKTGDDTYAVRVFFEVALDEEEVETSEDEATVQNIGGKWFVVSPPA